MREFLDIYDLIINKIQNDEKFSFVRYGDGEFAFILKNNQLENLKKKWGDSILEASDYLKVIIDQRPEYYFGIQNLAYSLWPKEIDQITKDIPNLVKADILHTRSGSGEIKSFFDTLCGKKIVLVGPSYLSSIKEIKIHKHIITEEYYVWNYIETIEKEIERLIKLEENENLIFLYSCSLAAKILIHKFSNKQIKQIDTGSLLDPYVGMNSRKYHDRVISRLGIDESSIMRPKIK